MALQLLLLVVGLRVVVEVEPASARVDVRLKSSMPLR